MKKIAIAAALVVGLTNMVYAAGNIDAGKTKAATCIACHGVDGNAIAPNFLNLAGQSAGYITKQLQAFKQGKRSDPTMTAMVMALDDQAMEDIAAYYASQKLKPGQADPALAEAGKAIYKGGIAEIGVPACMACHGSTGAGNPGSGYPQLASQKAAYTEKQLKDFRAAAQNPNQDAAPVGRYNDPSKMMRAAVKRMSDPEIQAVAQYIQGLQPGPASATMMATAPASAAPAPVAETTPAAEATPATPAPTAEPAPADAPAPTAASGSALYKQACFACHDNAVAGAPKFGDKAAWAPRIAAADIDTMTKTVITGKGAMPPKGGTQLSEAEIKAVVEYMVSSAQ